MMKVNPYVGLGMASAYDYLTMDNPNATLDEVRTAIVNERRAGGWSSQNIRRTVKAAEKEYERLRATTKPYTFNVEGFERPFVILEPRAEILRNGIGRNDAYNYYLNYNGMTNAERSAVREWRQYNLERAFSGGEYLDIVAGKSPEQLADVIYDNVCRMRKVTKPGAFHSAKESLDVFIMNGVKDGELPPDVKIQKRSELYASSLPKSNVETPVGKATEAAADAGKKAAKSGGKWGIIVGTIVGALVCCGIWAFLTGEFKNNS